ncbi:MAG: hypothetical protein KZQ80_06510 [Candidatus Thiodiazotropha sp. (ex Monitilora ramsayi)]|nr:hypothetical protein [Candidatus Thiodiazotropha sp. (ex Monitilora ramsayi)]
MRYFNKTVLFSVVLCVVSLFLFMAFASFNHEPNWHIEENAVASQSHPLAGFWKHKDCEDPWGWAIGPAAAGLYYVSFCGPGGCFEMGAYRPNSRIIDDPSYRIIDANTLMFYSENEWSTQVRCSGR